MTDFRKAEILQEHVVGITQLLSRYEAEMQGPEFDNDAELKTKTRDCMEQAVQELALALDALTQLGGAYDTRQATLDAAAAQGEPQQ